MKRIFLLLLECLLAWSGYAQISFEDKVTQALNNGQWFELRRLYEAGSDSIEHPLLRLLTESYLSHAFNQPEDACVFLDSLLMEHQEEMPTEMTMDLFFLKAANLSQMEFNKEAALTLSAVIEPMLPHLGTDSLRRWLELRSLYEAFSQFEKINRIFIPYTDGIAPFRIDTIGSADKRGPIIILEGTVNGLSQDIFFNTGSMTNTISEETATRLGLTKLGATVTMSGNTTGSQSTTEFAIAKELSLGNIVYRNVPFLIANPGNDSVIAQDHHLQMILGEEFMKAAQEIQIDFSKKHIRVPIFHTQLSEGEYPNLYGGLLSPYYTEAEINGELFALHFNTGNILSTLSNNYFSRHKEWIEAHCTTDSIRYMGLFGETVKEEGYKLKEVKFSVNGLPHTFPEIFVSATPNTVNSEYGDIGMDYLLQFRKVIFNTKDMFMKVIP